MHYPFLLDGVESPTKFSKRGDLTGSHRLEVGAGKEGTTFSKKPQFLHEK